MKISDKRICFKYKSVMLKRTKERSDKSAETRNDH